MSFDNVQALPPGTRLGDYRLDAMIGHGGFGITYRAFDAQLAKAHPRAQTARHQQGEARRPQL